MGQIERLDNPHIVITEHVVAGSRHPLKAVVSRLAWPKKCLAGALCDTHAFKVHQAQMRLHFRFPLLGGLPRPEGRLRIVVFDTEKPSLRPLAGARVALCATYQVSVSMPPDPRQDSHVLVARPAPRAFFGCPSVAIQPGNSAYPDSVDVWRLA